MTLYTALLISKELSQVDLGPTTLTIGHSCDLLKCMPWVDDLFLSVLLYRCSGGIGFSVFRVVDIHNTDIDERLRTKTIFHVTPQTFNFSVLIQLF